jgi:uncharacterized surface protein with fasciclin (FAS1) repeats
MRASKTNNGKTPRPSTSPVAEPRSDSTEAGPYRAEPRRAHQRRGENSLLETAAARGTFRTLGGAIRTAGLVDLMSGKGPFTLFAPTDKAFAKLPSADLNALLTDKPRLRELLSYHVVPAKVRAPRRRLPSSVMTLDGKTLEIAVVPADGGYRVDEARIVKTNMRASNGVVHAIDTILIPR